MPLVMLLAAACIDNRLAPSPSDVVSGPRSADGSVTQTGPVCDDDPVQVVNESCPVWNGFDAEADLATRVEMDGSLGAPILMASGGVSAIFAPNATNGALVRYDTSFGLEGSPTAAWLTSAAVSGADVDADGDPEFVGWCTSAVSPEVGLCIYNADPGLVALVPLSPTLGTNQDYAFSDVDGDGTVEILGPWSSLNLDGSIIRTYELASSHTSFALETLDESLGLLTVVTGDGAWLAASERIGFWDDGTGVEGGVAPIDGESVSVYVADRGLIARALPGGEERWVLHHVRHYFRIAIGDVDADGSPEICANVEGVLSIVSSAGEIVRQWADAEEHIYGSCSFVDLDGDGRYEVLDWYAGGLALRDPRTGETLFHDTQLVATELPTSTVAVADFDGDGSPELIVMGAESPEQSAGVLGIYHSPTGSWAPTRPIWNAPAYDAAAIDDSGRPVSRPVRPFSAHGLGFRAQPARVNKPDLSPLLDEDCLRCDNGELSLTLRAQNTGSVDADAVSAHVARWSGAGWERLWSGDLGPVDAGWTSTGVEVVVPADEGDELAVWVEGDRVDCNVHDDRVLFTLDCP